MMVLNGVKRREAEGKQEWSEGRKTKEMGGTDRKDRPGRKSWMGRRGWLRRGGVRLKGGQAWIDSSCKGK